MRSRLRRIEPVCPRFSVCAGDILADAGLRRDLGTGYDLVLANILARPLIDLSQRIVWACKPGACLVLSGLLEIQADSVEEAYMAQCLPKPRRVIDGEWCALVWD